MVLCLKEICFFISFETRPINIVRPGLSGVAHVHNNPKRHSSEVQRKCNEIALTNYKARITYNIFQ